VFNVVGGYYVPPRLDALTMWYMTAEPYHVSVLHIGVRDLGGAECSRRCCTDPAFGKVSISLTSHGHLTLVVASRGLPRYVEVSGYSVRPWAYK
jgi:hypothetical protein